jgi:hypothetical protein
MTTAIQLITRSMRLSGVLGKGETPDNDESQDGLAALNSMLDSFSIERLNVYYIVSEALTMVPSQATYTMDLNTTRPTRIEDECFIRFASIDTALTLIDSAAYASLIAKTISSNIPMYLFVDMQNQLVRLNFYPVPSTTAAVAYIKSWKQLQQFTTLTDVIALPQGYEEMLAFNLAVRWASVEFGQMIKPEVEKIAITSKANIKRINAPSPIMNNEIGQMNRSRTAGSIYTG